MRIGLNVHTTHNPQALDSAIKTAGLDTLLFYEPTPAIEAKNRNRDALVIDRQHLDTDSELHHHYAPAAFVQGLLTRNPDTRIVRYVMNEPNVSTNEHIAAVCDWLVRVMDEADKRGLRLVVGNLGVGSYTPESIDNRAWDALLRRLSGSPHYLGVHEYSSVIIPFGTGTMPTNDLLIAARVQPDKWVKKIPDRRTSWGLPNNFAIGRCVWFNLRSAHLNIPAPAILITEFGLDDINGTQDVIAQLAALYKTAGYPAMRGFNSLAAVYRAYFGSFDDAVVAQLNYAKTLYPDNVLAALIFAWSNHQKWADFDTSGWSQTVWSRIASVPQTKPLPPPPPVPAPLPTTPQLTAIRAKVNTGTVLTNSEAAYVLKLLDTLSGDVQTALGKVK
jgi:hypothetical protein